MKLTLEESWKHCLAMWKWIAEASEHEENDSYSINHLKRKWLKENGPFDLTEDCFFCDYHGDKLDPAACVNCPGYLVDKSFHCETLDYCYDDYPKAFYAKIKELNEIRIKNEEPR